MTQTVDMFLACFAFRSEPGSTSVMRNSRRWGPRRRGGRVRSSYAQKTKIFHRRTSAERGNPAKSLLLLQARSARRPQCIARRSVGRTRGRACALASCDLPYYVFCGYATGSVSARCRHARRRRGKAVLASSSVQLSPECGRGESLTDVLSLGVDATGLVVAAALVADAAAFNSFSLNAVPQARPAQVQRVHVGATASQCVCIHGSEQTCIFTFGYASLMPVSVAPGYTACARPGHQHQDFSSRSWRCDRDRSERPAAAAFAVRAAAAHDGGD